MNKKDYARKFRSNNERTEAAIDAVITNSQVADHVELSPRELIAMNLNDLMSIYGKSQSDLSAETGMSKSTVSAYCTGKRFPRAEQLEKLAAVFGLSAGTLIGEMEEDIDFTCLPIEIKAFVRGLLSMKPEDRLALLRQCEYVYPYAFNKDEE